MYYALYLFGHQKTYKTLFSQLSQYTLHVGCFDWGLNAKLIPLNFQCSSPRVNSWKYQSWDSLLINPPCKGTHSLTYTALTFLLSQTQQSFAFHVRHSICLRILLFRMICIEMRLVPLHAMNAVFTCKRTPFIHPHNSSADARPAVNVVAIEDVILINIIPFKCQRELLHLFYCRQIPFCQLQTGVLPAWGDPGDTFQWHL